MARVAEIFQRLRAAWLDLIGPDRSPPYVGEYETSNRLQRSLAHVIGADSQFSRFIRATPWAALHVSPVPLSDAEAIKTGDCVATTWTDLGGVYDYLEWETLMVDYVPVRYAELSLDGSAVIARVVAETFGYVYDGAAHDALSVFRAVCRFRYVRLADAGAATGPYAAYRWPKR